MYGPYQQTDRLIPFVILNSIMNKNFPCSNGKQFRDFIYVNDVVDLIKKVIKKKI